MNRKHVAKASAHVFFRCLGMPNPFESIPFFIHFILQFFIQGKFQILIYLVFKLPCLEKIMTRAGMIN